MTEPHDAPAEPIWPVILSGGAGTRLWPLSRTECPKQLLALSGARTMLQETALRTAGPRFHPPVVVCGEAHAATIAAQLAELGLAAAATIVEPCARNTAAAIALAALEVLGRDPGGVLLVMPSDHVVQDVAALLAAVERARGVIGQGWLATFGIAPDNPATGYGYIERGAALATGVFAAKRFIEKPARAAAEAMLAAGGHDWNGGLFLFGAGAFVEALAQHAPEVLAAARAALAGAERRGGEVRPELTAFVAAPSISVDYAVMEQAERVAVVPVEMGWSDIGAWDAVWELGPVDGSGNVVRGAVVDVATTGCLVRSDGPLVATLGISDLIVVATADAVLVAHKSRAQEVRELVARLPDPILAHRAPVTRIPGGTLRWLTDGVHELRLEPHARWSAPATLLSGHFADGAAGPGGARLLVIATAPPVTPHGPARLPI